MKVTAVKQQVKRADRYSVFVDDKYTFSLSDTALLNSHLARGDELTTEQVEAYKRLSADDKMYGLAVRYVAIRPRSIWEMTTYLERKGSPAPLTEQITNKLLQYDLLDDTKFAAAFVHDRRLFRPTSRRKIILELRKKHIANDIVQAVVGNEAEDEDAALVELVNRKRRQTRYQDDMKLMQYLARQGFGYNDIKRALHLEINT